MKLLLDNPIPTRLIPLFAEKGHDAIHVKALPAGSETSDFEIAKTADKMGRIVLTKDKDFYNLHITGGSPRKLLMIRLGNCSMQRLWDTLAPQLGPIEELLKNSDIVEVYPTVIAFSSPYQRLRGLG